ncbi:hypothetical protein COCSADRAFT_206119 [Bipolaris sorokiniana ND90Pr]|uniref:Uncharacterized protein n=1 Tax=Cochliobolus sativus (strain ND90Pr / ATCC 201652) TaxID=665912 RepID=M2T3V4_COCSN|nr:uncharacterized protein COCSADRAFT_206119 [Bipolaris sorokiniana ND90Pr]EMD69085.1 hypothetical protein COCSADRAFT_206119 [Bipolaris sorokiniana ND90Pr]
MITPHILGCLPCLTTKAASYASPPPSTYTNPREALIPVHCSRRSRKENQRRISPVLKHRPKIAILAP